MNTEQRQEIRRVWRGEGRKVLQGSAGHVPKQEEVGVGGRGSGCTRTKKIELCAKACDLLVLTAPRVYLVKREEVCVTVLDVW